MLSKESLISITSKQCWSPKTLNLVDIGPVVWKELWNVHTRNFPEIVQNIQEISKILKSFSMFQYMQKVSVISKTFKNVTEVSSFLKLKLFRIFYKQFQNVSECFGRFQTCSRMLNRYIVLQNVNFENFFKSSTIFQNIPECSTQF